MHHRLPMILLWTMLSPATSGSAPSEGFSHDDWTIVLQRFVDGQGLVDYEGLARDPRTFERYVGSVERSSPETDPDRFPTPDHALAYYLNAYNALIFQGVLRRGPETESVWSGLISGYAFFVRMDVTVGGERTSLKKLEDGIRKRFQDPRIHAALNCASLGCPRLPRRAFEAEGLSETLNAAMTEFVNDERNCAIDRARRTVTLSKIFDWFADDFVGERNDRDGALIDYVNRYRPREARIPPAYTVEFAKYDKRINKAGGAKLGKVD